jgi:two-component sensor histidine kinase
MHALNRQQADTEASSAELDALQQALRQKTALVHEVDHRVKNNLQLISSLFQIQARRADPATRAVLMNMLARINAIAVVHRRLFRGDDVERFDLAAFVQDLLPEIASQEGGNVSVRLDLESTHVEARKAASLALIVNELVTNAFRHGFPAGRAGNVCVATWEEDGRARIKITDDGVGMPRDGAGQGFGLTIVELLCRQIGGRLERLEQDSGVGIEVTLEGVPQ